jgi:cation:H+ antiporter
VSNTAVKVARATGLGELAVGFLLLSVITSLPELAVSILAVGSGDAGISVGTLFGSNIANLGLVLGVTAILAPSALVITRDSFKTLLMMLLVSSIVPILALVGTGSGTIVGLSLLLIFAAFCIYIIKMKVNLGHERENANENIVRQVLLLFGGVAVVLVSAELVVRSSVLISRFLGIEEAVIGATVIAVGTSLPELTVSLVAVRSNHANLALANIMGSCVTNLTLILGLVLTLSRLTVHAAVFFELVIMLSLMNLFVWRMLADSKIGFTDGAILTILYVVFIGTSVGLQITVLSPHYLSAAVVEVAKMLAQALVFGIVAAAILLLALDLTKR